MEFFKIAQDIDKEYYKNYLIAKKAGVNFLAYRCKISAKDLKYGDMVYGCKKTKWLVSEEAYNQMEQEHLQD